ncbi:MAG: bifunctional 4-hydroxy-2-oxoglutarate aldolase/2-dehydro-3-deoxy-phosphogluconate aldolase [Chloroflexi bacterium]|nr:bifunctional 4-hydroxy-2-oxoglutarate aldolase/2-dehydro-3-deoxy-phosphogluconate aldolase [Chloroflexota bacterium]
MKGKQEEIQRIIDCGVVAVVRLSDSQQLLRVAEAVQRGGVSIIEFTMTTPNALKVLEESTAAFGEDVLLGAGTVLDAETARAAILAGARFVVSPTLSSALLSLSHRYGVAVIPGAFTPTEILTAWELGADLVKVFPAGALGPQYLRDILAPLPQVRLLPTGGVSLDNAGEFIKAGAVAVAVGGNLVDKRTVAEGNFALLTERARAFVVAVQEARKGGSK